MWYCTLRDSLNCKISIQKRPTALKSTASWTQSGEIFIVHQMVCWAWKLHDSAVWMALAVLRKPFENPAGMIWPCPYYAEVTYITRIFVIKVSINFWIDFAPTRISLGNFARNQVTRELLHHSLIAQQQPAWHNKESNTLNFWRAIDFQIWGSLWSGK